MALRSGSIVWLRTGSPAMTVKHQTGSGDWICSWFEGKTVREYAFDENQLTETEPEDFD